METYKSEALDAHLVQPRSATETTSFFLGGARMLARKRKIPLQFCFLITILVSLLIAPGCSSQSASNTSSAKTSTANSSAAVLDQSTDGSDVIASINQLLAQNPNMSLTQNDLNLLQAQGLLTQADITALTPFINN